MSISALKAFDVDAGNVRNMYGNCGRAVKRAVARHFLYGKARLPVAFPEATLLAFAFVVSRAKDSCAMADKHMAYREVAATFSVVDVDVPNRAFKVCIDSQPGEEGVKALVQWFNEVADGLARVTAMLEFAPVHCPDEDLMNLVAGDEDEGYLPEAESQLYRAQFEALVNGDMSFVLTAPMNVVSLASLLSPQIDEAIEVQYEALTSSPP